MVLVACATQVNNQEGQSDSLDSAINSEIFILPPRSLYTMPADFDMKHFTIQNEMDTLIAALKNEKAVFSSALPPVPTWMDDAQANDSLYRCAYRKYVQCFVDELKRRGLPLTTLYVEKGSRESSFATVDELSTFVPCQFKLADALPDGDTPHQSWIRMTYQP